MSALPPVVKTVDVPCDRKTAFKIFVDDINSWWPLDRSSVSAMGRNAARSLSLHREGALSRLVSIEQSTNGAR